MTRAGYGRFSYSRCARSCPNLRNARKSETRGEEEEGKKGTSRSVFYLSRREKAISHASRYSRVSVHLYARRCMPVTSFSECLVPKGTEPDPRGIALALRLSVPFLLDRYTHTGRHVSQSEQVSLRGLVSVLADGSRKYAPKHACDVCTSAYLSSASARARPLSRFDETLRYDTRIM